MTQREGLGAYLGWMPICDESVCWFFIQRFAVVLTAGIRRTIWAVYARSGLPMISTPNLFGLGLSAFASLSSEFQLGLHSFSDERVGPGSLIPMALQRVEDNKRWRKTGRRTCRRHSFFANMRLK